MAQFTLLAATVYGMLGVILGAFGAHALAARLTHDSLAIWQTAVQYQCYYALALLGLALLLRSTAHSGWLNAAAVCFAAGVLVFSGSLYALALSNVRWLGAITPFGGLLFVAGWCALLIGLLRG